MQIAIDARSHGRDFSGIARYAQVLLLGIDRAGPGKRIAALVSDVSALPSRLAQSTAFEWIELPRKPFGFYQQYSLPGLLKRLGVRCLHSVDAHSPVATRCRRIITIHDLIPLVCLEQTTASAKTRWRQLWKLWLLQQVRNATLIATISACSQRDIVRELGVQPEMITVIPPAAEIPVEIPTSEAVLRERLGLRGRIILSVGRRAPHKNLIGLLGAFSRLGKIVAEPLQLVIVGNVDARYPEPEREVARRGLSSQVRFAGHVSDEDLAGLYRMTSVLAFPSLYEGYGLPILEAMHFGVPVVASDRAALPEVVGDAGLLVDPMDSHAFAMAMASILLSPELAADLGRRGTERAARLTPQGQGVKYLELYDRVLHGAAAHGEAGLRYQV